LETKDGRSQPIFKASKAFAGVLSPIGLIKKRESIAFPSNSILFKYINNKKETTGNGLLTL